MITLPDDARAKLLAIDSAAQEAEDVQAGAQRRLAMISGHHPRDANIQQQMDRLDAKRDQAGRRREALAELASAIRQYLSKLPADAVLEPSPVTAAPRKGETLAQSIARTRDEITAARMNLLTVRTAPPPKSELKVAAAAKVKSYAAQGAPDMDIDRSRNKFDLIWVRANELDFGVPPKVIISWLAWLAPELMLAALIRDIDARPEPQAPIASAERQQRMAELASTVDRLEREEEALIESAQAQGLDVCRRENASPLAVLGLTVRERAAVAA